MLDPGFEDCFVGDGVGDGGGREGVGPAPTSEGDGVDEGETAGVGGGVVGVEGVADEGCLLAR